METPADVVAYYSAGEELTRLESNAKGRIERERTRRLLLDLLPPAPARVLDVGGGTGAYATWLRDELGHDVEVIDPVPLHVERCRALGFTADQGDARALPHDDDSFDAVLLLGPLYHLQERADRVLALREAHRVVRPGGLVAAAVISRYASWLDILDHSAHLLVEHRAHLEQELADGRHDPPPGTNLFTTAYFHDPVEAPGELIDAGLHDVDLRAIEGPSWLMASRDELPTDLVCDLIAPIDRVPSLFGASAHLLVSGRKP